MNISVNTQAILLLTSWFTRGSKADYKPLTPSEWGRFANWLKERDKTPLVFWSANRLPTTLMAEPILKSQMKGLDSF